MSKKNQIIVITSFILLLLLTLININNFLKPMQVLGASTIVELNNEDFWEDFLNENPNYLPGLIEKGDIEKVRKINPNFIFAQ